MRLVLGRWLWRVSSWLLRPLLSGGRSGDYLVVPHGFTVEKIIHKLPSTVARGGDPLDQMEAVGIRYRPGPNFQRNPGLGANNTIYDPLLDLPAQSDASSRVP